MSDLHHDHLYIGGAGVAPATDARISVISPLSEAELGSTPEGAPADQYSVDHSAAMAVLDPQARMAGVIQPPLDPQAIAQDMTALTGMPPR